MVHWLWALVGGDFHTEEIMDNLAELGRCDGEGRIRNESLDGSKGKMRLIELNNFITTGNNSYQ